MRTTVLLALALVLSGIYFSYRIARLEQRLDTLNAKLGQPEPTPIAGSGPPKPASGHEQRLAALESDLRSLRDDMRTLEQAVSAPPSTLAPGSDQQILSVVGREQERIRDRQLEFHRTRWVGWRESALGSFSARNNLAPVQTEELRKLLTSEVDQMIEILRRPDSAENPEKATKDWVAMLRQTDEAARSVLDPAQRSSWDAERAVERHVLWPWLPEISSSSN
jgi:hypothetical protein